MALNKMFVFSASSMVLALIAVSAAMDPMVETGTSEIAPEGRHVGVNVPPFYWLKLDTRGPGRGVRMNESIMSGLVQVNLDRTRDPQTGKTSGPIQVKVGGITVYDNTRNIMPSMPNMPSVPSLNDVENRIESEASGLRNNLPSMPSLNGAQQAIQSQTSGLRDRLRSWI